MGPLGTAHEHLLNKLDPPSSTIRFSREEGTDLITIIQRSIQLAGNASATISQKRRVAVLTNVNKAYVSLGKEDFSDSAKDLFGKGFEARLKERTETAKAINEAKKVGQQLFRPAPGETCCGSSERGDSYYYISRRPCHPSRFEEDCQTPPGNSYESSREFGGLSSI